MAKKYKGSSVYWPEKLIQFVQGPMKDRTKLKLSPMAEVAMEAYIKEQGLWNEFQNFVPEEDI